MPSDRRLKLGFIGCGNHATCNIYPSLQFIGDKIDLVAVADLRADLARRNARVFGAREWYGSHEEMLKSADIDAVIVVTPTPTHAPIVVDCLNAGLHVFVEKPLADTIENAEWIVETAEKNKRHVMVAFMKRFAPTYRKAKEISDSPDFGRHFIQTKFCSGPYKSLLEHLIDFTIHHFDLVRFFMGEVETLYALMSRPQNAAEVSSLTISLKFKDGSVGSIHTGSAELWTQLNERIEVVGNGKFIIVDNLIDFKFFDDSLVPVEMDPLPSAAAYWMPNYPIPASRNQSYVLNGYVGELDHFVTCILEGKKPIPSDLDGLKALQLAYATMESIEKGKPIKIEWPKP